MVSVLKEAIAAEPVPDLEFLPGLNISLKHVRSRGYVMGFVILEPEESVGHILVGMALKEKQGSFQ
jgi:hypothetical protein